MCGIAALLSANGLRGQSIALMTGAVSHRGPDDEGYATFTGPVLDPQVLGGEHTAAACYAASLAYTPARRLEPQDAENARVAMGHRRLSILDLSPAGHQPMGSADGRVWIAFNGEIYNYLELREELKRLGRVFSTRTDTEVILSAYLQWGADCLRRFNGMFSFVLLDRQKQTVFCARDRFGVKPFYYFVPEDGLIAVASEIKQFSTLPGWRAVVNGERAHDFLAWGMLDHSDETLFHGVFQLRGGEALELKLDELALYRRAGKLPAYRWYELKPVPFSGSMREAARRFNELFEDSIALRLRADVPVGSCLSGGLDSSSIVCVANRQLRRNAAHAQQLTFSAISDVARFNESAYMDEVVRQTGVAHFTTLPDLDRLFQDLPAMTWHNDEPFGSTSIFAQWSVFRLAAENGVKVMLDGQGADESLAGYHGFFRPHFINLLLRLRWIDLAREIHAARRLHRYSPLWAVKLLADGLTPEPVRMALRRLGSKAHSAPNWINAKALGVIPRSPDASLWGGTAKSVSEESRRQLVSTSLQMLLHWEDRDSMAHSIESRVPFLDYRLVEFLLGLPDELKLWNGTTKRVLREAMAGTLPEQVRLRQDKIGFATAEEVWFRDRQPELFRAKIRDAIAQSRGVLAGSAAEVLEAMQQGKREFSFIPWRMISFGQWMEQFDVQLPAAAL